MDFDWINSHINDDTTKLRLKFGSEWTGEIMQIECRRKYASKLRDTLAANPEFIFPTALSGEQSTSDLLASYHASLIDENAVVADLTCGLGIDAMALARKAERVVAVERDRVVADALVSNSEAFSNLTVINCDCRDFITQAIADGIHFDVIFIDPARRAADGSRTYALSDCEPDVVGMISEIARISDMLIIKASPMLDITATLRLLPSAIAAVAVGTAIECKELDIICRFDRTVAEPEIKAVTVFDDHISEVAFLRSVENATDTKLTMPAVGQYLYDPYPAVMKASPMKVIASKFGLSKPHPNTNLWIGDEYYADVPAHAYVIDEVLPFASKNIKRYASRYPKVSITARNFDMSADVLRTKLKTSDGPMRLFAITSIGNTRLLLTCHPAI